MSLRGAVLLRVSHGRTYAQGWPRRRGQPSASYQKASLERMSASQRMVKYMPAAERATMEAGLARFMRQHTGIRGTAAIRLRDWLTQIVFGTAWAAVAPDGTVFYSAKMRRDCSDFLDWIEPRIGSLMVRTDAGWRTTINCKKGAMLTMTDGGIYPDCCASASIPNKKAALGGTP